MSLRTMRLNVSEGISSRPFSFCLAILLGFQKAVHSTFLSDCGLWPHVRPLTRCDSCFLKMDDKCLPDFGLAFTYQALPTRSKFLSFKMKNFVDGLLKEVRALVLRPRPLPDRNSILQKDKTPYRGLPQVVPHPPACPCDHSVQCPPIDFFPSCQSYSVGQVKG